MLIDHRPNGSPVDVLIAARNEQADIGNTIRSLVNQTIPCHVILVDNASTDSTIHVAAEYGITIATCPIRGKIPCLREGHSISRSPIVAIADADTVYPPDWIAKILDVFNTTDDVLLVFGPTRFGRATLGTLSSILSRAFVVLSLRLGVACAVGYNLAARHSAIGRALTDVPNVAGSGWALATAILRTHGRSAIRYRTDLIVPKNPRRYETDGTWRLWRLWASEWFRLASRRNMRVSESDYYHFDRQ
jgi:cellulose synthase/poly-beta-1,6-N-acetylglucosamine synthase-like glycosyltransferase